MWNFMNVRPTERWLVTLVSLLIFHIRLLFMSMEWKNVLRIQAYKHTTHYTHCAIEIPFNKQIDFIEAVSSDLCQSSH